MSYGFAPMCAFVDHGEHGTGETLALDLRPERPRRSIVLITVLVRADAGGASKAFLHHLTDAGLHYSIGFPAHAQPVIPRSSSVWPAANRLAAAAFSAANSTSSWAEPRCSIEREPLR